MRNGCDEHIVVREQSVMGEFNPAIIKFGDKHKRLEDKILTKIINICEENKHNVDMTECVEGETDDGRQATERINNRQF